MFAIEARAGWLERFKVRIIAMNNRMPKSSRVRHQMHAAPPSVRKIGENEAWLFTALQSIGDAVIVTDVQGAMVYMNSVAAALTGWNEDEARGADCCTVFRLVDERTRLEVESPVAKVRREGTISVAKHTLLIARNGAEHHIDISGSPIRDKMGHLIGVVLLFRDVMPQRESEAAYQTQQDILRTLFDHIPVIVAFLDENGQFQWLNREWTRLIGWSLAEMHNLEHFYAISPALFAEHDGNLRGIEITVSVDDLAVPGWHDVKITTKQGRVLDLTWATVRLGDGTRIGIGQDITRRKQAEAQAGQRIVQVEMLNGRLLQAMRETDHRVKNNLQSIASLLDMQTLAYRDSVPVGELTQIRMHINTLASIHSLLVADVKDDKIVSSVSAKSALHKLLPMLSAFVGEQRLHWRVDEVTLPIKQVMSLAVLTNELVGNAVKHGGQYVDLRLVVAQGEVMLEVGDDGPGFSEVFDPRHSANFGLELVESVGRLDLGGRTTYENRPEGGACVRVTFPIPETQESSERA